MECVLTANASDTFNFGPDTQSLSVKRIAEIAQMSWPFPTDVGISGITPVNESEALILNLDSQKARDILHWSPFWSQEKAVVSTLNWWNEVLNKGVKSADACARDIEFVLKSLAGK
jgi:CDP-glucose 4,6-dehydratase